MLFGSQAREDAVDGSDIDIMIKLKDKEVDSIKELRKHYRYILADLSLEFDQVISCIYISENRYLNEKSPLLINVRREGIVLLNNRQNLLIEKAKVSLKQPMFFLKKIYAFSASKHIIQCFILWKLYY
ncbi:MAG: nucleotidyltransferase domain-containing protein [Desulfobacterales bacterium]|nr:nucleotidyltransferase domain-containing protein [Desulfobacterales bacterium]